MIPVRDGIRLSTDIYFPRSMKTNARLPVVLVRTPYSKEFLQSAKYAPHVRHFVSHGYIVAVQDKRGRFESEGRYVFGGSDAKDGYDTVNWLAEQTWSSGKVGTYGCSYAGFTQVVQAPLRNPHLKTMIIQAGSDAVADAGNRYRRYHGIYNGGAFEMAYLGWFAGLGSKVFYRPPAHLSRQEFLSIVDQFTPVPKVLEKPGLPVLSTDLMMGLPITRLINELTVLPTDYSEVTSHDVADSWWRGFDYLREKDRFSVPALHVDSWYDMGPADTLALSELFSRNATNKNARENQYVLISPTTHCETERITAPTVVGKRDIGDARIDALDIYRRWYDYWLKGDRKALEGMPKYQYYTMGEGANEWRGAEQWPIPGTQFVNFYLHSEGRANSRYGDGSLSKQVPSEERSDTFVYDPADPVPTRGGTCCFAGEYLQGAQDQRPNETRSDVLVYTSDVLKEGVEVTGPLSLVLYVSSDVPDTDFTAKLVDVYPDGRAYNLQEGVLRLRYREGFDRKVWMQADQVYEIHLNLQATSNYFAPGHRIRLDISSSNFPRFDRNLNTGGNNYDETQWKVATNTVHHSPKHASRLILPVVIDSQ